MISEPVYAVVRSGRKRYTKMFSKCLGCCEGKAGHAVPLSTGCYVYMRRLFKSPDRCEVDAFVNQSNSFSSSSSKSRLGSASRACSDGGICFSCFVAASHPGAVFGTGCNAVRGDAASASSHRRPCSRPVEGVVYRGRTGALSCIA